MDRITHGGSAIVSTEFEVRTIDTFGDVENVDHFDSRVLALAAARATLARGAVAVVVEKHIRRRPAFLFDEPETYRTVATLGDPAALAEGGWT